MPSLSRATKKSGNNKNNKYKTNANTYRVQQVYGWYLFAQSDCVNLGSVSITGYTNIPVYLTAIAYSFNSHYKQECFRHTNCLPECLNWLFCSISELATCQSRVFIVSDALTSFLHVIWGAGLFPLEVGYLALVTLQKYMIVQEANRTAYTENKSFKLHERFLLCSHLPLVKMSLDGLVERVENCPLAIVRNWMGRIKQWTKNLPYVRAFGFILAFMYLLFIYTFVCYYHTRTTHNNTKESIGGITCIFIWNEE